MVVKNLGSYRPSVVTKVDDAHSEIHRRMREDLVAPLHDVKNVFSRGEDERHRGFAETSSISSTSRWSSFF